MKVNVADLVEQVQTCREMIAGSEGFSAAAHPAIARYVAEYAQLCDGTLADLRDGTLSGRVAAETVRRLIEGAGEFHRVAKIEATIAGIAGGLPRVSEALRALLSHSLGGDDSPLPARLLEGVASAIGGQIEAIQQTPSQGFYAKGIR